MINRPLTPHITVYSSQFTSKYSIWHRITGFILISILLFYLNLFKINFLIYKGLINNSFCFNYLLTKNIFIVNSIFIFSYHLMNGVKNIKWDLGYTLVIKTIFSFYVLISVSLFYVVIILMLKIIN